MTTTLLKEFLEKQLRKQMLENTEAKLFMQWIRTDLSEIYSDLETDEDGADHIDILFSYFIPHLSDEEVEATVDNLMEVGIGSQIA